MLEKAKGYSLLDYNRPFSKSARATRPNDDIWLHTRIWGKISLAS